jgi:hypothetical protein
MSKKNFRTSFDSLLGDEEIKKKKSVLNETRATFIVRASHLDKLKAISYWERKMIKNVLDDALSSFIEQYEARNGPIQLPK